MADRVRPVNIRRYRWTEEEKEQIFDQLLDELKPKDNTLVAPLVTAGESVEEAVRRLQEGDKIVGLESGYHGIDELTKGFAPGELIVVYGHTSHGKSQLCQNIAVKLARKNIASLIVSLEMTKAETTGRLLKISTLEPDEFVNLPIFYPEATEISAEDIDGLMKAAVENGAQLAIIDHLHYFNRSVDNAQEEIGRLVNLFKRLAIKYEIPVLLISHIVKSAQAERMPKPQELKGSSFIAQDADILLGVWRDMEEDTRTLVVRIFKNRNRGFSPDKAQTELAILDDVRLADRVQY